MILFHDVSMEIKDNKELTELHISTIKLLDTFSIDRKVLDFIKEIESMAVDTR